MGVLNRLFRRRQSEHGGNGPLFHPDADRLATSCPKILWIELTSKCPFGCIFCTRDVRWGAGQNLDFEIYRSLIAQLDLPEFIGLNYSGESIHYPRLIEAIRLAVATGAYTELVTALGSAPQRLVHEIVESGLDRLAVSLHSMDPEGYKQIYQFSSIDAVKARIDDVLEMKAKHGLNKPKLDFCFVAMSQNLSQLVPVARYARSVGAGEISIHPIIGRHPVPYDFSRELESNKLTNPFKTDLRSALDEVRREVPSLPINVLNPDVEAANPLNHAPKYYASPLPAGARIFGCDQSPFESVHVLASGNVVVCEVHDEVILGNLKNQTMCEIWHGDQYRQFRRNYIAGVNSACRECVWKMSYLPDNWKSSIAAKDGMSAQLMRGWFVEPGNPIVWSKPRSVLGLRSERTARRLGIAGMLPQSKSGANQLTIYREGTVVGQVTNPTAGFLKFNQTFHLAPLTQTPLFLDLVTDHAFRPSSHSDSRDSRDLGFALEKVDLLP